MPTVASTADPIASTSGNVHLRLSLYRAVTDHDHSLALSKAIVAAKLQNSRRVIDRWVTEFIGAIESVGLDFQMGFFHRPRSGRPSLALDLAEELRALTDRFVVSLIRRRQVNPDSFLRMPGDAVYMSDEGRTSLIKEWEAHKETEIHHAVSDRKIGRWALPSVQATLLARHLRGDLPAYPPFVMV